MLFSYLPLLLIPSSPLSSLPPLPRPSYFTSRSSSTSSAICSSLQPQTRLHTPLPPSLPPHFSVAMVDTFTHSLTPSLPLALLHCITHKVILHWTPSLFPSTPRNTYSRVFSPNTFSSAGILTFPLHLLPHTPATPVWNLPCRFSYLSFFTCLFSPDLTFINFLRKSLMKLLLTHILTHWIISVFPHYSKALFSLSSVAVIHILTQRSLIHPSLHPLTSLLTHWIF